MKSRKTKSTKTKSISSRVRYPYLIAVVFVGIIGYFAYKYFGPRPQSISINEIGNIQACNSALISDNFEGQSLDINKWKTWLSSATSTITQANGTMNINSIHPGGVIGSSSGLTGKSLVTGNFTAEITVSNLQASPIPRGSGELAIANTGLWTSLAWRRHDSASYIDINTGSTDGRIQNQVTGHLDVGAATTVKLRLVRNKSTTSGYADIGSGYQLVGTLKDSFAGPGYIQPVLFDNSNSIGNTSSVKLDNLKFHCPKSGLNQRDESTSGGVKQGAVPSVTILMGNGSAKNLAYGYGGGLSGNSAIKMQGVAINNVFYPWGFKGEVVGYNPTKGAPFTTADGRYTTYGSTVVEHDPKIEYTHYTKVTDNLYYIYKDPITGKKSCRATSDKYYVFSQKSAYDNGETCAGNIKANLKENSTGVCYTSSVSCAYANK